jgi:hypothetical protein
MWESLFLKFTLLNTTKSILEKNLMSAANLGISSCTSQPSPNIKETTLGESLKPGAFLSFSNRNFTPKVCLGVSGACYLLGQSNTWTPEKHLRVAIVK